MPLDRLLDALPPHAADLRENLALLLVDRALSDARRWGCLLTCAYTLGEPRTLRTIEAEAPLDASAKGAAKGAAAVMAMNTVYYRAVHAMKVPEYATLPAHLRMQALAHPGVDRADFELWCLAASALSGCGVCLDAHEAELRTRGTPSTVMQAALRIAAVVNGVACVLAAETALNAGAEGRGDADRGEDQPADGR